MSSIPENFPSLPPEIQVKIIDYASEKDVYNSVNKANLFSKLNEMPFVAQKYYTYAINQEIWKVHKDERLEIMKKPGFFRWIIERSYRPKISKSEKELRELLPSQIVPQYLTRLNLKGLNADEIAAIIKNLPETLESLIKIDLRYTNITAQDLQALLQRCPNLKKLNLSLCPKITNLDPEAIPELVKLERLDLSYTNITAQALQVLLQRCPNAKILNFKYCDRITNLDPTIIPELAQLETLVLADLSIKLKSSLE